MLPVVNLQLTADKVLDYGFSLACKLVLLAVVCNEMTKRPSDEGLLKFYTDFRPYYDRRALYAVHASIS